MIDLEERVVEIYLDWPPSVNNYYNHTRYGVHVGKRGRAYRESVATAVAVQLGPDARIHPEPVNMTVVLFQPDKRQRDLDNHMKGLLDAIQATQLISDDALIDELHIYRGEIVHKGAVFVKISAGGGWKTSELVDEDEGEHEFTYRGIKQSMIGMIE